jgi:hypothetical protein
MLESFVDHVRERLGLSAQNGTADALSDVEIVRRMELAARDRLGVSRAEAYRRLDRGELDGTMVEVELTMLRYLLEGEHALHRREHRPSEPPSEQPAAL